MVTNGMKARRPLLDIAMTVIFFSLALYPVIDREPNTPLAIHVLAPLGAAFFAVIPWFEHKLPLRCCTFLNTAAGACLLSSVFYGVFVTPGSVEWFRFGVALFMLGLFIFAPKRERATMQ